MHINRLTTDKMVIYTELVFFVLAVQACCGTIQGAPRSRVATTLATFNAAIVSTYPEQETRANILAQEIRKSRVDIFCFQEVWRSDHQRLIYNAVNDLYPYSASLIDLNQDVVNLTPPCTLDTLLEFAACVAEMCPPGSDVSCLVLNCGPVFRSSSIQCKVCIGLNFITGMEVCLSQPSSNYDITFGLMVISNKELKNISTGGYLGNISESRGYIKATVDGVGDITCTHLSSVVRFTNTYIGPPLFSPPQFTSYAEQQYNELRQLLDIAVSDEVDTSILMGDFNHGPGVATSPGASAIGWTKPFHYGLVVARGFMNPYLLYDGRCTFCKENPGTALFTPIEKSYIVDHIYIPNTEFKRLLSVERFWDDITTPAGIPLSDHYGIKMTLRNIGVCLFPASLFCSSNEGRNTFLPLPLPNEELTDLCHAVDTD